MDSMAEYNDRDGWRLPEQYVNVHKPLALIFWRQTSNVKWIYVLNNALLL